MSGINTYLNNLQNTQTRPPLNNSKLDTKSPLKSPIKGELNKACSMDASQIVKKEDESDSTSSDTSSDELNNNSIESSVDYGNGDEEKQAQSPPTTNNNNCSLQKLENMKKKFQPIDEPIYSGEKEKLNIIAKQYVIAAIIVVLAILVLVGFQHLQIHEPFKLSIPSAYSTSSDRQKEIGVKKELLSRLDKTMNHLKAKYNQSDMFWANIESSFKHSVISRKDPSIVMFVNDPETRDLSQNLVYDIINELQHKVLKRSMGINQLSVDPLGDSALANLIESNNVDRSKLYIDTFLSNIFSADERLALVKNIEHLPARAMILFYTYGDYENAKFPGVLIFMSLNVDQSLSPRDRERFEEKIASLTEFVEGYLFNLWQQYIAADQLRPLFTRIANNLCFVRNN